MNMNMTESVTHTHKVTLTVTQLTSCRIQILACFKNIQDYRSERNIEIAANSRGQQGGRTGREDIFNESQGGRNHT